MYLISSVPSHLAIYLLYICMSNVPPSTIPGQVFKVLSGYEERYLAAGLKLPVVLQYCPQERGVANRGELEVFVEDKLTISVPMEG